MIIFIPTRGRVNTQVTRQCFYMDEISKTNLVVYVIPKYELHLWKSKYALNSYGYESWTRKLGINVHIVSDDWKFSDIRQNLVSEFHRFDKYQVCMDDDLRFLRRRTPTDPAQLKGTLQDSIDMFKRIEKYLTVDGYHHGAISTRPGNNNVETETKLNTRALDLHFYNAETIFKEGLKFTDVLLKQDLHMTMSMLELGYQNIVDYYYIAGQTNNGNNPGGCNLWRTLDMLNEASYTLQKLHPKFIKTRVKKSLSTYGGVDRIEVTCYWKKCFNTRAAERKLYR